MADLAQQKRVRGGHKSSTTKMLTKVDEVFAEDPIDISQLVKLKMSLREKMQTLNRLDQEVLALITTDDGVAKDIEESDAFKDAIYAALVKIEDYTSRRTADPTVPAVSRHVASTVKLPKLTIQPFNGEPTRWTTFWDSYSVSIHGNDTLSDTEKFTYLRSLLQGRALESIAGLALSDANYIEAVGLLKKRFGNKQVIISKHMEALMKLEPVSSDRHIRDLRTLFDETEIHLRSLKSLGIAKESYGALLSPVLLSKLPPDLRLIVSREVGDSDLDLDKLLEKFGTELAARERAAPQYTTPTKRNPPDKSQPTGFALLTGNPRESKEPYCSYCSSTHTSINCPTVIDVNARKAILRRTARCYNCLRRGHILQACRSPARCQKCKGKHHTSICDAKSSNHSSPPSLATPNSSDLNAGAPLFTPTNKTTTTVCANNSQIILLQTAKAVIKNPANTNASVEVRLLLDGGSQRSYLSERARKFLQLNAHGEDVLSIATFGAHNCKKKVCPIVDVQLCLKGYPATLLRLYVVPTICEPLVGQPIASCIKNNPRLLELDLADSSDIESNLPVDLLVGSDYYWELVTGEICRPESGPIAIHTKVGWVLSGPSSSVSSRQNAVNLSVTHVLHTGSIPESCFALDEQLQKFWDLEALGINSSDTVDTSVLSEFKEKIQVKEGRYEVALPWKHQHHSLPDNYELCHQRLQGLIRRLRRDPVLLEEYDSIIRNQVQQGIVEHRENIRNDPQSQEMPTTERIHYLPHHAVIRRDKDTTKLRIVYDASARSRGPSLNDCLHIGPKLQQNIFDLLLRFRTHRVGITADIEKAFLMIGIAEEDRDVLRFLWVDNINSQNPDLIELRFARVVFGISSSPFLLNATLQHLLEQQSDTDPLIVQKLARSFYVDDAVTGAHDENEAYSLYQTAKSILKRGGFNLRKFRSNSRLLQLRVDHEESLTSAPAENDKTCASSSRLPLEEHSVLGVKWDTTFDQLVVSLDDIAVQIVNIKPTKRAIVSLVGHFYDPLGLISPVVICFKIFLQELCVSQLNWDDPLTDALLRRWTQLSQSVTECKQAIRVPRCYLNYSQEQAEHHLGGFCDASLKAYAAVVYMVSYSESATQIKFVASKTRVSPLKKVTIPRLELLSALLLARLITGVTNALQHDLRLSQPRCFTDSTVALHWILGEDKSWKTFVENRVSEIRQLTPPECWAHCPGKENPADLPSRGLTMQELATSGLWLSGPAWLKDKLYHSPEPPLPEECLLEMKLKTTHGLLISNDSPSIEEIIDCTNFSSLNRLFSVSSRALQFCWILIRKVRSASKVEIDDTLKEVEIQWIQASQKSLPNHRSFPQWQRQFGLYHDENNLLRCGGRLQNADLPQLTIHPILLDKTHHLTTLFIRRAHERVKHSGVKATITELRSKFWIVKGRSIVRQVLQKCSICRRHEGPPCETPPPPPLPTLRVKEVPPFVHTGVDFAGPLFVKTSNSSDKVWVCLFTCCIVRAVHLEVVPDLTTEAFLRCMKRFIARRGMPHRMLSDNGRTFEAAAGQIKAIVSHPEVKSYLAGIGVQWTFNLPKAPWWGGVFERMVKAMKRCLRKSIGRAKLSLDELTTALVEVEAVLNSRPLTYLSTDDLEEPLTPSHLLVGRRLLDMPDHICDKPEEFEATPDLLTKRARHLEQTVTHFWRRWKKEYLLELRESHRYHRGKSDAKQIEIDDVVVIHDEDHPRSFWRLGRVKKLVVGQDGTARGAILQVAGKGCYSTLRRPLQRLYPLEIAEQTPHEEDKEKLQEETTKETQEKLEDKRDLSEPTQRDRPIREAARRANQRLRELN